MSHLGEEEEEEEEEEEMSTVHVLEPPTKGKVTVNTTHGPIDIELWPKEAPKSARNFVQLCLEGYFDNTIFHRVIPGFLVQGGDPTGSGTGGDSIYGCVFADEFHSRLRFNHRGIVAMANASSPNSNGSQFFFTLDKCDWLDKKHTIFGKVTGDSIFNLLSLGEVDTDKDYRPLDPAPKILSIEVLWNPFEDIVPRVLAKTSIETVAETKEPQKKPVKSDVGSSEDEKPRMEKLLLKKKGIDSEVKAERMEKGGTDLQIYNASEHAWQLRKSKKRRLQGNEDAVLVKLEKFEPGDNNKEEEEDVSDWKKVKLEFAAERGKESQSSKRRKKAAPLKPASKTEYRSYRRFQGLFHMRAVDYNNLNALSHCFAVVGDNMVVVLNFDEIGLKTLGKQRSYRDENVDESFTSVSWACEGDRFLIVAGGLNIRVIDSRDLTLDKTLNGHEGVVNDIRRHPFHESLVLSASNDKTIRLWSVITGICLARFDGTAEVVSADFHLSNRYVLVSSGSDKFVRVWYMTGGWRDNWMNSEETETITGEQYGFPMKLWNHRDCVECIRFLKNALVSQGENGIVLSTFANYYGKSKKSDGPKTIKKFPIRHKGSCKFKTNGSGVLAVGNKKGEIYVLDCHIPESAELITISQDCHSNLSPITQTAISTDGRRIFTIHENGCATLWLTRD